MAKKKRLNRRLVILLSVVFVLGSAGAGVGWLVSRPKDPAYYYEQATKALNASPKQYDRAQKMFAQAIAGSQNNINRRNEYRYEYAMMLFDKRINEPDLTPEKRGQVYWAAIEQLKDAIEDDPSYMKARLRLADEYWGQASSMQYNSDPHRIIAWNKLIEQLDAILKQQQNPEMYFRRAVAEGYLAEEDKGDAQQAVKYYRQAVATSKPGDQNAAFRSGLGKYLLSLGKTAEAEKEYKDAIAANPKNASAYIGYAEFLLREKRRDEGIAQIQAAIDNDPTNEKGYIYMAQVYAIDKKLEKALELLKSAPKDRISGVNIYTMEGGLYAQMDRPQEAVNAYRSGLDAIDKQLAENKNQMVARNLENAKIYLVTRLARVYLYMFDKQRGTPKAKEAIAEAEKCQELLVRLAPGTFEQLTVAGRIAYAKGDLNQARKDLEAARKLRDERMQNAAAKKSLDPDVTRLLWVIYERTGLPSKAKRELQKLLAIPGQQRPAYVLALANHELRDKNYPAARVLVNKVLEAYPDNEQAKKFLRNLDIAQNHKLPSDGTEIDATSRNIMLRLADDYVTDGQNDKAIKVLRKLVKSDTTDKRALVRLVGLLRKTGHKDAAMEVIDQAVKDSPDDKNLATLQKVLHADDPEKAFAIQMQTMDEIKDPVERNLRKRQLCLSQKKTDDADKYLKAAEKANPSDLRVVNALYTLAVQDKDWGAAQRAIDRLPEKDQLQRELYKARLLDAQEQYAEAAVIFKKLLQENPNMVQVRLALTNCYLRQRDYDNAENQMLIVVENDSSNVNALVGLARLASQRGNLEDFEKWIRAAYKYNAGKRDPYVKNAYLTMEVDKNDPEKAIVERERTFEKNPHDFQNALRLAGLYENEKQLGKAEEKYQYIIDQVPDKIRFSPVVANFYLRINRPTKGYALFDSLLKTAKTPKEKTAILVHYGDFLVKIGEVPSAEGMYKKAVEADPENPSGYMGLSNCYAAQANQLTRMGQPSQADKAWADSIAQLKKVLELANNTRFQKILCYRQASAGRYQDAIDGYRNILKNNPADKSARLGIASIYQSQNEPQKALAELDGIIKDDPQYAQAYAAKAQVYTKLYEFKNADAAYREALDIDGNLNWMLARARLNAKMGDTDRALSLYADTIAAFPNDPRAYIGKMRLLKARREWVQVKLLAETGMANPAFENVPDFTLLMAEVYKLRKQPRQEIEMLKKAVEIAPGNPRIVRNYLQTLALNHQYSTLRSEAKKYIDNPGQKPGIMGILALAYAVQNPNTPEALNRFEIALKEAGPGDISYVLGLMLQAVGPEVLTTHAAELSKIHPNSWEVPFVMARAWSLQRKFPEAVAEYQKAVELTKIPARKANLLLDLAGVYAKMKQDDNVEKMYRKVLEIDPDSKAALNNLAYLLAENFNRPKEALPLSERAMTLEPGSVNVVDTYAWILARLGEYTRAMAAYDNIKDRKMVNAEIPYHIAIVAEKLKKYEQAKEFYQQALATEKTHKNPAIRELVQQGLDRVTKKLNEE